MNDKEYNELMENNNINNSIEFKYPKDDDDDDVPPCDDERLLEMLRHLADYILPSQTPVITMAALFYTYGIDISYMMGVKSNDKKLIAEKLGISITIFNKHIKKVIKDFDIKYIPVKISSKHDGELNIKYDYTVHTFMNKNTGIIEHLTQNEFYTKYDIDRRRVGDLTQHILTEYKGWVCYDKK